MRYLIKKIIPKFLFKRIFYSVTMLYLKYYKNKFPFLIIRKNTSDLSVFKDVFVKKDFKLPIKMSPKIIIDAGAYTGYSSLYFHSKYPNSKIIAIEPEKSNFEILKKNLQNIKNILLVNAGLWNKNAFLKIINRKTGKWGFITKEVKKSEADIKAITMNKILKNFSINKIDILKIDIEGSEKELFSKNYENWINKVNIIIIEFHERIKANCIKTFYSAINLKEWKKYQRGENHIFIRKKFV